MILGFSPPHIQGTGVQPPRPASSAAVATIASPQDGEDDEVLLLSVV